MKGTSSGNEARRGLRGRTRQRAPSQTPTVGRTIKPKLEYTVEDQLWVQSQ